VVAVGGVVAHRGQEAVVGEVGNRAAQARLAVAQQAEGIAVAEAEGRFDRRLVELLADAEGLVRGFQQQDRFDLAARLVPDRKLDRAVLVAHLRMRACSQHEGGCGSDETVAEQGAHGGACDRDGRTKFLVVRVLRSYSVYVYLTIVF
jgi:hypothetical protein